MTSPQKRCHLPKKFLLIFQNTRILVSQKARVMITKLTLTVEDKVIASAKIYAQKNGKSLSHLVENYLKSITADTKEKKGESISPKVLKLMGVIKLPKEYDYKIALGKALAKKYAK